MKFDLVECHLKWIDELLDHLKNSTVLMNGSVQYLKTLMEEKREDWSADFDTSHATKDPTEDSYEKNKIRTIASFRRKFNLVAFYTYIGEFDLATKLLDRTTKLLAESESKKELKSEHHRVAEYFIRVSYFAIETFKSTSRGGRFEETCEYDTLLSNLKSEWDQFPLASQAAAVFFKGCLAVTMRLPNEEILKLNKQAAELEPDQYLWHRFVYERLYRMRRQEKRSGAGSFVAGPSTEEIQACEKAFELCSSCITTISNLATLYKDSLWMQEETKWNSDKKKALQVVKLYRQSLDLAVKDQRRNLTCIIKVHLAELLSFGKCTKYDQEWGKTLFEECVEEFPKSSMVHHKLAKLYHKGTWKTNKYQNFEDAMKSYKRALECGPTNYACVLDYLKFLNFHHDQLNIEADKGSLMIQVIKEHLSFMQSDWKKANLRIIQGLTEWSRASNGKITLEINAYKAWLEVVKLPDPYCAEELYEYICSSVRPVYRSGILFPGTGSLNAEHVIQQLKLLSEELTDTSDENRNAVRVFIENLARFQSLHLHEATNANANVANYREDNYNLILSERRRPSSTGDDRTLPWRMKRKQETTEGKILPKSTTSKWNRNVSQADNDPNWRLK